MCPPDELHPITSLTIVYPCFARGRRGLAAQASASGGKRISQNEFTEKAWQSIIAAPDIAQNASQQIVDTEHLFKALLEQPNGLARRILAKAGSNPTQLLEKTDQYIRRQPRVTGDSSQVCLVQHQLLCSQYSMPFAHALYIVQSCQSWHHQCAESFGITFLVACKVCPQSTGLHAN